MFFAGEGDDGGGKRMMMMMLMVGRFACEGKGGLKKICQQGFCLFFCVDDDQRKGGKRGTQTRGTRWAVVSECLEREESAQNQNRGPTSSCYLATFFLF